MALYGVFSLIAAQAPTKTLASPPDPSAIVSSDVQVPDESVPSPRDSYDVAAHEPRRIVIPSIEVDGFIQKVGLNHEGAVSAPSNVNFAGWYVNSVVPGEAGLSIVDGHVSGRYSDGIFADLHQLKPGDTFEIEFGNLSRISFEVHEKRQLAATDAAGLLFERNTQITSQLNLITCGGEYDPSTETFEERLIVVAKRVSD